MRQLTVLHVGDIHYPEHTKPDADVKDDLLAPPLVATATASELRAATRALLGVIDENPNAILAFTGDLTSRGNLAEYTECVKYLQRSFMLTDAARWNAPQLHCVPGNHDVDRALATKAPSGDLYFKFRPLADAWHAEGLDIIATDQVRQTRIEDGPSSLMAYGLNSCLGSGERRELPQKLHAAMVEAMTNAGVTTAAAEDETARLLGEHAEIIDAPAYAEDHIDTIYASIQSSQDHSVAVVIAHHNVLQQAQPRFDPYTDIINSGMFRSRLTSLAVPVLYLHGHIHSDPIEEVTQLAPDQGQLICISAPLFKDGFNRIELSFSDEGIPIGCVVQRYRVRLHGGTSAEQPVRIKFRTYEAPISPVAAEVGAFLLAHPGCSSLVDVQQGLGELLPEEHLAAALEEVEWLGMVEVINRERAYKSWRLRVVTQHD
jgi:hypothetical protein